MQPAPPHLRPGRHDDLSPRSSRRLGWAGLIAATAAPAVIWRSAITAVSSGFQWDFTYLVMGWTGYVLIAAGLLFMLPVVISIGRSPDSRLYPRARNAYLGWGVSLYLLGLAVAAQVAQIAAGPGEA